MWGFPLHYFAHNSVSYRCLFTSGIKQFNAVRVPFFHGLTGPMGLVTCEEKVLAYSVVIYHSGYPNRCSLTSP